ncbi:MAG: NosD domain-containing protein [Promethearchaeota archaeon]
MKKNKFKLGSIVICLIILGSSLLPLFLDIFKTPVEIIGEDLPKTSRCESISNEDINHVEFNEENPSQIEQSGSWNLTGTPILIDNNWTAVKDTYDWCTGEGTESEPYLIENVTIDFQGIGSCITIQNSTDYFIIQNCTLYDSFFYTGIILNNVSNGKLINNYCYWNFCGISLSSSNNNTVSGNTVSYNRYYGISLSSSDDNTILGNTVNENQYYGISLSSSNNTIVSGNTVSDNLYGILLSSSDDITISGNTVSDNTCGISLSSSNNNTVSGNTAIVNQYFGIILSSSNSNTISGNTDNNSGRGIFLSSSNNTIVSGNTFSHTSDSGIHMEKSKNNTVSGNTASDNTLNGIYLSSSNNIIVSGNNFSYNHRSGIVFDESNNITILGNIISNNNFFGMEISLSDDNTISGNIISNTNLFGIILTLSNSNTIFLNMFTNNTQHAHDFGTNNMWDNGSIGNYWDDYQGVDANNDGIGDTPYLINGTLGSQDNFPIFIDVDSSPLIPFGNYFLFFTIITIISLTILEQQKKKSHLR